MTNNGKDNANGAGDEPVANFATSRQGGKGVPPRQLPHPESACFGCLAVGLGVFLAVVLSGYVFWRFNPEFHPETAGPTVRATPTPAARRGTP
jgi:hypothetical protein